MEYTVKFRRQTKVIHVDKIDMVMADLKCLDVYTEGRVYILNGTIKQLLKDNPDTFIEVNRGKLVRPSLVEQIKSEPGRGHFIILNKYQYLCPELKISRSKFNRVKAEILAYKKNQPQSTKMER